MASRTRPRILLAVFVASMLAHWLVLWALPQQVAPPARATSRPAAVELEITTELPLAPAMLRRPFEPEPAEARTASAPPVETAVRKRRTSRASASTPPLAEPPPAVLPSSTPAPGVATAAPEAAPVLSPRAAALSMLEPLWDDLELSETGPMPDDAELARQRSAELSADLAAAALPPFARRPAAPELRTDPDGTCHFEGHSVHATILPDGGVVFEERPPRARPQLGEPTPPERPMTPEDAVAEQRLSVGVEVRARAVEAERDWFLQQTRALRDELADAARRRELARARTALRSELRRIWCDAGKSPAARRRAIFAHWDQTSRDEIGQHGRDTVIDFIRRHLPEGTVLAYSTTELASLNARRSQTQPFAPYSPRDSRDAGVN